MSAHALTLGGVLITGIVTRTEALYDGISIKHRGSTRKIDGSHEPASIALMMSPHDALELAHGLIRAAEKHGINSQRDAASLIRRLAKAQGKKIAQGEQP